MLLVVKNRNNELETRDMLDIDFNTCREFESTESLDCLRSGTNDFNKTFVS